MSTDCINNESQEMCIVVHCPVCDTQLTMQSASPILVSGVQSNYCTTSSYNRNIKNIHMNRAHGKKKLRKIESSTSSNRGKKNSKGSKPIERKPKRRCQSKDEESDEFSSSDSDDNIKNEMNENFQRESDMDIDSDCDENSSTQNCDVQQTKKSDSCSSANDHPGRYLNFRFVS